MCRSHKCRSCAAEPQPPLASHPPPAQLMLALPRRSAGASSRTSRPGAEEGRHAGAAGGGQ
eukprot:scaffold29027_cov20-Tisochrysis_lutea.AAC.6